MGLAGRGLGRLVPSGEGQAQTSDKGRLGARAPQGRSGAVTRKETGEGHRPRLTDRSVAQGALRKWLCSWPLAALGAGISSRSPGPDNRVGAKLFLKREYLFFYQLIMPRFSG